MPLVNTHKNHTSRHGGLIIAIGDVFAVILSFCFAMSLTGHFIDPNLDATLPGLNIDPYERHYLYSAVSVAVLIFLMTHGHYSQRIPWWNQVRLLSFTVVFAMLAEGSASFALGIHSSAALILLNWVLFFFLCIAARLVFFRIRAKSTRWNIPTVVIGDTSTITDILYAFNADPSTGYDVHTAFLRDKSERFIVADLPKKYAKLQVEYDIDHYEDYIINHPCNYYVIVLDTFRGIMRDRIVETLNSVGAQYSVVPSISRISIYEMEPRYFFGFDVMLLQTRTSLSHPLSRFGKRFIDIASSLGGLLVFSPLFLMIIIAMKAEGHEGSIFYGGERLGQDGKLFKCWKFRTMSPNSDYLLHDYLNKNPEAKAHWEKYLKLPKDPRVKTRTAHLLRKSSLDEIPQLWNVFRGNMSLVGPRPILPNEVDLYGETIKEYVQVKPGITGLWQVSGRNAASFQRRIYWDGWYVRNWSFWGDIVIILKTIPAVIIRDDGH